MRSKIQVASTLELMHVILDSTALVADFNLTSAASRGLLEGCKRGVIRLAIPELVLWEVANKYRERVIKLADDAGAVSKAARRLGFQEPLITLPTGTDAASAYEVALRQKLIESRAIILRTPDVSHEILVRKAIQRDAPFADKGTGYRDALIWESIKDVLRLHPAESVTFVTANRTDFGSNTTSIRQSLLDELSNESISHERLSIVDSPVAAAVATLDRAQRLVGLLEEGLESDQAFHDRFFEELTESADADLHDISEQRYSPQRRVRFLDVTSLYDVSHFKVTRSWLISSGKIGVEFEAEADADVEFEYGDDALPHFYDPRLEPWPETLTHHGSDTVIASLTGQVEYNESTEELVFGGVLIWALSEPDTRH